MTKLFNANTSQSNNSGHQGQQHTIRLLRTLIPCLLALCSPGGALATPDFRGEIAPVASAPPPLVSALQFSTDSLSPSWKSSIASTLAIARASQQCMSQKATPEARYNLSSTSPKVSPADNRLSKVIFDNQNFPFQARARDRVRFVCHQGQWHAEVSSHIGAFSCHSVLHVVCSQGTDVTSNLEVLSKYPSWYRQRQIHVLGENVCPTLGEVVYVYVEDLGLKVGEDNLSTDRDFDRLVCLDPDELDAAYWCPDGGAQMIGIQMAGRQMIETQQNKYWKSSLGALVLWHQRPLAPGSSG